MAELGLGQSPGQFVGGTWFPDYTKSWKEKGSVWNHLMIGGEKQNKTSLALLEVMCNIWVPLETLRENLIFKIVLFVLLWPCFFFLPVTTALLQCWLLWKISLSSWDSSTSKCSKIIKAQRELHLFNLAFLPESVFKARRTLCFSEAMHTHVCIYLLYTLIITSIINICVLCLHITYGLGD